MTELVIERRKENQCERKRSRGINRLTGKAGCAAKKLPGGIDHCLTANQKGFNSLWVIGSLPLAHKEKGLTAYVAGCSGYHGLLADEFSVED